LVQVKRCAVSFIRNYCRLFRDHIRLPGRGNSSPYREFFREYT
jgi:hypothetical protein